MNPKLLYININNEHIQSNEELEVLEHDLDSYFFFYLGERISKACNVENENALITDFNTPDTKEDYKQIIAQWNEIKTILFCEECKGNFEFTLPNGYIHWLEFHPQYVSVYDRNFSHGEPAVIAIDLEELYEDSIEDLQRKILRKLQRDDLYLEIDEIIFNDNTVTRKSPIVCKIKEKYEGIGFKSYIKWLQDNDEKPHTTPQVCEKRKKNPCECNTKPISSDNFFPYQGFTLGETLMKEFGDDLFDDSSIIHYDLDNGVTLLGATKGDTFIAAGVDSTISSNNKLPKEWSNLLGCRFGVFREKCRRALSEKDFKIILDEDAEIVVVSPSKKYRIHLAFDVDTSKFVALLITLNECPYCKSNNFALRKINAEAHISYCTDCDKPYLFEVESEELDEVEENDTPSCPNCSSDDVDDDGSDYLQYTCNDCGHNWGHDDTVECPECGSDDVENDGTDSMQYECNACGHIWGDDEVYDNDEEEDYDDTDNSGNIMSTYLETLNIIPGITTKHDIIRQGGVFVKTEYGANADYYEMPNGVHVQFHNDIVCVIRFHENSWHCIPLFYKNLGLYWGIDKIRFRNIFEGLGFSVYDDNCITISASRYCEKYNKSVRIEISYVGGDMITFSIS